MPEDKKAPDCEGFGRLKAVPAKQTFHWYEKLIGKLWLDTLREEYSGGTTMVKRVLGLDLGSNSLGWALFETDENAKPHQLIDLGVRIFTKAVEEKNPTPKSANRRQKRLARRVIQRRARRKRRLANYLIKLGLLPSEVASSTAPERVLNALGDPYALRAKALDEPLTAYEMGRLLLHLVQRRGFLSNRKTLLGGEMLDDPDVAAVLAELSDDELSSDSKDAEESEFKQQISALRGAIERSGARTLGEYLASRDPQACKRNRKFGGEFIRTDRQMYRDELQLIWDAQAGVHNALTDVVRAEIEKIIFHQRPLRQDPDRIGRCSLELRRRRTQIARLDYQRFRYLQDLNNLEYFDVYNDRWCRIDGEGRMALIDHFETHVAVTFAQIRSILRLDRRTELNLDSGVNKLKGNTTACAIRELFDQWDDLDATQQDALVDDLLSIKKKSALKRRLIGHWRIPGETAVRLCLLDLEPGYGNVSAKAIRNLLPHLQQGKIFSDARVAAGYAYAQKPSTSLTRLPLAPSIPNPIVRRGLSELRRVVNAIIAEYGKPDVIRIEMARDLEMNTKRYKSFIKQQRDNTKLNDEAAEYYREIASKNPHLGLSNHPSRDDKIRYRLWKAQGERCAYSGAAISLTALFSGEIEIDHVLPFSRSLDDSFMNKVVCFAAQNRLKGDRTPFDAFSGDEDKWNQITQSLGRWDRSMRSKKDRFFRREQDLSERDFIGSQLSDTRYMSREAATYLRSLGVDVSFTKGVITSWLRHQWNLDGILGSASSKDRNDHRHHAIDAAVIACVDRVFYRNLAGAAKAFERSNSSLRLRDLYVEPPWPDFRAAVAEKIGHMLVSHTPHRKISGALHEETGVGFKEGIGTVYRVPLDSTFKRKQVEKIYDPTVRAHVAAHLAKFNNDPKAAFTKDHPVHHKDGRTPIKRVRIVQSKTSLDDLKKNKFDVRNQEGAVFKWLTYGNNHHVEILRHRTKGAYRGAFVTTMEAAYRARGLNGIKRAIVRTDHGPDYEFIVALSINNLVSAELDAERNYYRIQKLEQDGRLTLRLHSAATITNDSEKLHAAVSTLMKSHRLQAHRINAIGKILT